MQYYRCKCGKCEAWGSLVPARCEGCDECGTTLDVSASLHTTPIPHTYVTKYDEDSGAPYQICSRCGQHMPTQAQGG